MTAPTLREALEAFLRVWEGGAVAPVNFLQGLAGAAEQARAALAAAPAPALDVAEAAVEFDIAERAYWAAVDRPDKPQHPDLDDPAVAEAWFAPWNRMRAARLRLHEAAAAYAAAGEKGETE